MPARRKEASTAEIKIRMKEPIRARIERSAKRRGISMNAEMNDIFEQWYRSEDHLERSLQHMYGPQGAAILSILGEIVQAAGRDAATVAEIAGASPFGDPGTSAQ